MGDMLEKITVQLQQKRSDDEEDDGSLEKINRATNTGSMDSLKSSESMTDKGISKFCQYLYSGQKTRDGQQQTRSTALILKDR